MSVTRPSDPRGAASGDAAPPKKVTERLEPAGSDREPAVETKRAGRRLTDEVPDIEVELAAVERAAQRYRSALRKLAE